METGTSESTTSRGSRLRLILGLTGAGGCLGLVALVVLLVVLFFRGALDHCPPKDFPVYPGARQTDFNYTLRGDASSCVVGWDSDDVSAQVSTFYDSSLATGAWRLVSKDSDSGFWYFQQRDDGSTIGRIHFLSTGAQTRIEAEILTGQSPTPSASP